MKDWKDLPVSAQVKRIRQALRAVLPRWGLGKAELKFIFHGENTTFRAETPRGCFLVRVARHGYNTPKETESELAWAEAVHHDLGIAQRPARTMDGEFVVAMDVPGSPGRHVCVMHWVEGRIIGKRYGSAKIWELGALMAKLHHHSANWKRPKGFKRRKWDRTSMFQVDNPEETKLAWEGLSPAHRREFKKIQRGTSQAMKKLSSPRDFGLIHADLHVWNLVNTRDGMVAIDFDDCGFGPWLHDLATTISQWREKVPERVGALLEGYRSVRDFSNERLELLPQMVASRYVGVILWATARAQDNEFFRKKIDEWQDAYLNLARNAATQDYGI